MAKRFTDTDKWKKPFLRGMKAPYKLLWLYILDECDHAGIWQVDLEVAEIKIGEKLKLQDALKYLEGKISILDGGKKWFIFDFIEFQYGVLNPQNRAHNSVISLLQKNNVIDENYKIKPLISPLQGAKDMDMDKDKDKDKDMDMDMDMDKGAKIELIFPFDSEKFLSQWKILADSKKWKKKPLSALQASLKILSKENEADAIQMIENCIAGDWMGLVELKPHQRTKPKESGLKPIVDARNEIHERLRQRHQQNEQQPNPT